MSTERQKQAARRNIRKAQKARASGKPAKRTDGAMTSAERNDLDSSEFAFPEQEKEPIHDAAHVRNAIARFDQVEDVTDAERDRAWARITRAAKKYDIEVEAADWRDLYVGGKARKH
jgi:hypothetical protein